MHDVGFLQVVILHYFSTLDMNPNTVYWKACNFFIAFRGIVMVECITLILLSSYHSTVGSNGQISLPSEKYMSDKRCKTGDRQSWPVQLPENKLQHRSVGSVTVKTLHVNQEMINIKR